MFEKRVQAMFKNIVIIDIFNDRIVGTASLFIEKKFIRQNGIVYILISLTYYQLYSAVILMM